MILRIRVIKVISDKCHKDDNKNGNNDDSNNHRNININTEK